MSLSLLPPTLSLLHRTTFSFPNVLINCSSSPFAFSLRSKPTMNKKPSLCSSRDDAAASQFDEEEDDDDDCGLEAEQQTSEAAFGSSHLPDRWDVLGLGQAMVTSNPFVSNTNGDNKFK